MPPKSSPVPQRRMGMRGSTLLANFSLPMALGRHVGLDPAGQNRRWRARRGARNSTASARIIGDQPALGGGVVFAARGAFDGRERGRADQHTAAAALDHVAARPRGR